MGVRNMISGCLVTAVFIGTFYLFFLQERNIIDIEMGPGQTVSHDIIAPVDFSIPYRAEELNEIRESVVASIPVHLLYRESLWQSLRTQLYPRLLLAVRDSSFAGGMLEELDSFYRQGVFDLEEVRNSYDGDRAVIIRDGATEDGQLFSINEMEDVRETFRMRLRSRDVPSSLLDDLTGLLQPNLLVDDSSRHANASIALAGLSETDTVIAAGSIILGANQPATARTVEYLEHLKRTELDSRAFRRVAGLFLLILLLTGTVLFYVRNMMADTWRSPNRFLLLGTIWTLSLAATGTLWLILRSTVGYPYATMVTFGAALTAIFFHRRDAVFISVFFSLMAGLVHPHPYSVTLIGAVAGTLTSLTVWDVRQRRSVPVAIALAAGGGTAVLLLLKLLGTSLYPGFILESVLVLILVPVVAIGSAHALLLIFERLFRVYTVLSIDEVNKTDHPLLVQMREMAPGTWNHSQTVAELAGRAAGAIGAWESLASAGGYFHDIGKLRDPGLFIENQRESENPHDDMAPLESARRIIAHVADGVAMAEKAKLPRAVIEIIRQHHGVSLARFFYSRALKEADDPDSVRREGFSYGGPKPSTVEAALVMLADQVSSVTKNIASSEEVSELVSRVVDEKDLEGELDDCHLTRGNLKTVIRVFTSILESKFYKRVSDYPTGETVGTDNADTG